MDFSDMFRIVNLATGVLMVLGGVAQFFPAGSLYVQSVIIAVYMFIFGLGTALLEFRIPPPIAKYASFMFSFLGRGIFYIFVGSVTMGGNKWFHYTSGAIIVFIGIAYAALEYIPSIEPPANMRDADPSWGAEQI